MACYNLMLAAPYLYSKTLRCKLNLFLSKSQNFSLSGITKPLKENRLVPGVGRRIRRLLTDFRLIRRSDFLQRMIRESFLRRRFRQLEPRQLDTRAARFNEKIST